MPPKTRDFLANFGMSKQQVDHQELNSQSHCSPDGELIFSNAFELPSDSQEKSPRARPHPLSSLTRSDRPGESSLRARSRSPPAIRPSFGLDKFTIKQLKYVRLIPRENPTRQFEIREYIFPRDAPIVVKGGSNSFSPKPPGVQAVLSTLTGDVFAIVVGNNRFLRGLYALNHCVYKRAKINMNSSEMKMMTTQEIKESPLRKEHPISKNFRVIIPNEYLPEQ